MIFFKNHNSTLLFLSSADGARHQLTAEGDLNVISYNLAATSKDLYDNKFTSTQSLNILTHMQVCANKVFHAGIKNTTAINAMSTRS